MMNKYHSIDNINKITSLEYIVMFLLLCISGNPLFVYANTKYQYFITVVLIYIVCVFKNKQLINGKFVFWLISSCLLFVFQFVSLEYTSVAANVNFIARLYIAFLVASLLGYKFREAYLRVMVFICSISLIFFTLDFFTGNSIGIHFDRYNTILFYNSILENNRNSGMFWEPGAFQGYIMFSFLLYSDNLNLLWKNNKIGCIIMVIALITTQSTTGYVSFAIFIVLTLIVNQKLNVLYKIILVIGCILVARYIWYLDFMGDKIIQEYESAMEIGTNDISWSRIGSMFIDLNNIARHPLIGNGFMNHSRYGILGEYMTGMGNGLSGAVNMFGIPFVLLYFIGIFSNLKHISRVKRVIFIFIIAVLLFGEYFLNYSTFWSLLFIKYPNNKND